jgi:hypothetical protein
VRDNFEKLNKYASGELTGQYFVTKLQKREQEDLETLQELG